MTMSVIKTITLSPVGAPLFVQHVPWKVIITSACFRLAPTQHAPRFLPQSGSDVRANHTAPVSIMDVTLLVQMAGIIFSCTIHGRSIHICMNIIILFFISY